MRTLKLLLAYDGTDYVGWQRQPEAVSVQGLLEAALEPLAAGAVAVVGAGRTDAGVHATGQVASVRMRSVLSTADLRRALNARLPPDVRVLDVEEAADAFHARLDARSKTYEYRIVHGPLASPIAQRYAWHLSGELDHARIGEAAVLLEGEHDFSCFQSAGGNVRTSVRRVSRSVWLVQPDRSGLPFVPEPPLDGGVLLVYRIAGSGFLRHMVRAIVGTLVEVGRGVRDPADVAALLAGKKRAAAGPTAPAHGLCLTGVEYDPKMGSG
jgi:tRNA pseudouridine38-40 synthase